MICFAWSGFPQYAARCIGAFVASTKERVVVVATRPKVPIEGMEARCGCEVFWIDSDDKRPIATLLGEMPRAIVVSGWSIPAFNRLCDEVRRADGRVIAMFDHNFHPRFMELARAIRFRMLLRNKFDGFFVPGKSGVKLLRFYGVDEEKIVIGMYSADQSLFKNGKPLDEREKNIIYVGQFIDRKNVCKMVDAFKTANNLVGRGWKLELYGSGHLRTRLEKMADEAVSVNNFVQPEQLGELYRKARCFCLLSKKEHWGVVVHEAALSGCFLLLSDGVGAAEDFVGSGNGIMVSPKDDVAQVKAFKDIMLMGNEQLLKAQEESLKLARNIGLATFVAGVKKFL